MALLNILQFPDVRLKKIAEPVDVFDQEITQLATNMLETMYEVQGVGLAAIQVNVQKQVIVIDVSNESNQPLCLINPEILSKSGSFEWDEGCLSFPGIHAKVMRAHTIEVKFHDIQGKIQKMTVEGGLLSACIQHEMDHLNGITFYDHLSPLKQTMLKKKLDKIKRRAL